MNFYSCPTEIGYFPEVNLDEVMYYLYLPIGMPVKEQPRYRGVLKMPKNVLAAYPLVHAAIRNLRGHRDVYQDYIYLSARKGWATPDSPLNRPGWHCDGFGTDDINFLWWVGPGTRFAIQEFYNISQDHNLSLKQFEMSIDKKKVFTPKERTLQMVDNKVVHATPDLKEGCMRQYIKISFSRHKYNLYGNSHNYLFNYKWDMVDRANGVRNDTHHAQKDFVPVTKGEELDIDKSG